MIFKLDLNLLKLEKKIIKYSEIEIDTYIRTRDPVKGAEKHLDPSLRPSIYTTVSYNWILARQLKVVENRNDTIIIFFYKRKRSNVINYIPFQII